MIDVTYVGQPFNAVPRARNSGCSSCSGRSQRGGMNPRYTYYYLGSRFIFRINEPKSVAENLAKQLLSLTYVDKNGDKQHVFK